MTVLSVLSIPPLWKRLELDTPNAHSKQLAYRHYRAAVGGSGLVWLNSCDWLSTCLVVGGGAAAAVAAGWKAGCRSGHSRHTDSRLTAVWPLPVSLCFFFSLLLCTYFFPLRTPAASSNSHHCEAVGVRGGEGERCSVLGQLACFLKGTPLMVIRTRSSL